MKINPLAMCATIAISASFALNAKTNQLAQFMSNIEGSSITHQDYKKYVKKTVLVGFEQTGYQGKDVKINHICICKNPWPSTPANALKGKLCSTCSNTSSLLLACFFLLISSFLIGRKNTIFLIPYK